MKCARPDLFHTTMGRLLLINKIMKRLHVPCIKYGVVRSFELVGAHQA